MAQFIAANSDVEVSGDSVLSVINGMELFKRKALDILEKNGISDPKQGSWHKQQNWLDAFRTISEKIGTNTLYSIGLKIPETAKVPPDIDSAVKALSAINVGYHLNHRLDGKPMFDMSNGQMADGIGHYQFVKSGDGMKMVCDNPYPCDFDRGIIQAFIVNFGGPDRKSYDVVHDPHSTCRKNGDNSCTYLVKKIGK